MALSNEELQDIISRLSPEDRQNLLSQLGRQVKVDNISNPTHATGQKTQTKVKSKNANSKVYYCHICGSNSYKKKKDIQTKVCKDNSVMITENHLVRITETV